MRRQVLVLYVSVLALVLPGLSQAETWYARGAYYSASGELGQSGLWGADAGNRLVDDGTYGDAVAGDNIYSRLVTSTEGPGWYEFKIGTVNWSDDAPDGYNINCGLATTVPQDQVLITFDTNVYSDGWTPTTRMVWCDKLVQPAIGWFVVGGAPALGDWNPSFGAPATLKPTGLYMATVTLLSAGTVGYKWTADRTWVIQEVSGQGFSIRDMAHNLSYAAPAPGEYDFAMNPATGRAKAGPTGTVATDDASWSRIKTLYLDHRR